MIKKVVRDYLKIKYVPTENRCDYLMARRYFFYIGFFGRKALTIGEVNRYYDTMIPKMRKMISI